MGRAASALEWAAMRNGEEQKWKKEGSLVEPSEMSFGWHSFHNKIRKRKYNQSENPDVTVPMIAPGCGSFGR